MRVAGRFKLRPSGSYGSPESAKDSKVSSPLWIAKWSASDAGWPSTESTSASGISPGAVAVSVTLPGGGSARFQLFCEVGSEGEEHSFHFCDSRVCIDERSVKQGSGDIRSSASVNAEVCEC